MNHTIVASFSFALLVAVALLVREVRFRHSLQRLLYRLLAFWRTKPDEDLRSLIQPRRHDFVDLFTFQPLVSQQMVDDGGQRRPILVAIQQAEKLHGYLFQKLQPSFSFGNER